jgi:hypothetical protein
MQAAPAEDKPATALPTPAEPARRPSQFGM